MQVDCEASFAKPSHLVRNDDRRGILLRVADTASKSLEEANSGGHLSFFRIDNTTMLHLITNCSGRHVDIRQVMGISIKTAYMGESRI